MQKQRCLTFEEAGPTLDLPTGGGLVRAVGAVLVSVAVPRFRNTDV